MAKSLRHDFTGQIMADSSPPLMMRWDGESLIPANARWFILANKSLVVGEEYLIFESYHERRSGKAHNHYFACVTEAWRNLPESHSTAPYAVSSEHLRKYALIKCGYSTCATYVCESNEAALRLCNFIDPLDEFSIVTVNGSTLTVFTAMSQSKKSMGAREFQESKKKVLDYLSELIGVETGELLSVAGQTA